MLAVLGDVTEQQVNAMMKTVGDRFGPIDLLINNAGMIQVGPVEVMILEKLKWP
ncbi:MAG TPA: SDR family NAD(P)-dependent oxidoreductase [Candidatus Caenarcaniphilales bacterium]